MSVDWLIPAFLTIVTAATPLVFAAVGEAVVEKAGVLNLGIEGMMIVGAIAALMVSVAPVSPVPLESPAVLASSAQPALAKHRDTHRGKYRGRPSVREAVRERGVA